MKNDKLIISFIEPVGGHGGQDDYDFPLCEALHRAGGEVTFYTCDETMRRPAFRGTLFQPVYKGIFGRQPAVIRGIRYLLGSLSSLVRSRLAKTRICHYYYFNIGLLELFNVALAKMLGMKVIITANDIVPYVAMLTRPNIERLTYRLADGIVTHNAYSKKELMRVIGLDQDKIHAVPHGNYIDGIDRNLTKEAARTALGVPQDANVLLFFGRIRGDKGVDILQKAFQKVSEEMPGAVLIVAGYTRKNDFVNYPDLRDTIDKLHAMKSCMAHVRFIPKEAIDRYFVASDIVVVPYRRIYFSGVLLLAMSYGRAVIASDLDAMKEVVEDGVNGFLFESGNPDALSEKIKDVLSSPASLAKAGEQARLCMENEYNWNTIGGRMLAVYRRVLRER